VGWVSIVRNDALRRIFSIPANVVPIAYLCVGYVKAFPERATFQSAGWLERLLPQLPPITSSVIAANATSTGMP
jgi:5,6-dimethylbenzimidazole synthase